MPLNHFVKVCFALSSFNVVVVHAQSEDPRCNKQFVEKYSVKQDCFREMNSAACLYYVTSGMAAPSGMAAGYAMAQGIKFMNPSKDFLARYNKAYASMLENQMLLRDFKAAHEKASAEAHANIMKNRGDYQHFPTGYHRSLTKEILSKNLAQPGKERLKQIFNEASLIDSTMGLIDGAETAVEHKSIAEFEKAFPKESAEYRKSVELAYNSSREAFEAKEGAALKKVRSELSAANSELHQIKYEGSPKYSAKRNQVLQLEDEVSRLDSEFKKKFERYNKEIGTKVADKFPHLALFHKLKEQAYSNKHRFSFSPAEIAKYEEETGRKAARSSRTNSIKKVGAGLVGAGIGGLVATESLSLLAEKQVDRCASSLGLSGAEITLVKANVTSTSMKSCNTIRLADPKSVLDEAQTKFGFVPRGICELVLRENVTLNSTTGLDKAATTTCNTTKGDGFSSERQSDGKLTFTCRPPTSDLVYTMPMAADGTANFDRDAIKAVFEKDGRTASAEVQAKELGDKIASYKTEPFLVASQAVYERATPARASEFKDSDDRYCYEKAALNKALVSTRFANPECQASSAGEMPASASKASNSIK